MPVRTTMQYLIDEVRALIGDPATDGKFTDQQIQDKLDLNRKDLYEEVLDSGDTITPSGVFEWLDFYSQYKYWEEDVVLQEFSGEVVTPDTEEPLIGRWTFVTSLNTPELMARGRVYDVYGVAGKLLHQMQNDLRNSFNFTADGLTVQRISQVKDLQALADKYASMGWKALQQVKLVRKDLRY